MSSSKILFIREYISTILETAHDANRGSGLGKAGGYSSTAQTVGGQRTMGASIYPYLEEPTENDDDGSDDLDDTIAAIASKTNSFRPNFDPNNQRKDNRTLGGNPMGESRWGGLTPNQLPSTSKGMVTQKSRELNSPKGNKGTAMGGQNTRTHSQRKTGSIRDFSAGTKDMNRDLIDEPVYDFADILGHADDGRGNIDRMRKLTWILQQGDE